MIQRTAEFVLIILFSIILSACSNKKSTSTQQEKVVTNDLAKYKSILQGPPFNLAFTKPLMKPNDTTQVAIGQNEDNTLEARIHFDPRNKEFYWIEFMAKDLPFHPNKLDCYEILEFSTLFDKNFTTYYDRNFTGITLNENDFVDSCRFGNREKGFA